MPDRIKVRGTEVVFTEETFGGLNTDELSINRNELAEYELELDIEGTIPLNKFMADIKSDEVELDFSRFRTNSVEIHKVDIEKGDNDVSELKGSLPQTKREDMPPIPDDSGLKTESNYTHYQRLVRNPDSQPAKYRRLIRNEGKITRPALDRWAERQDLDPSGGSHNASLLMLERIGEIERRGRGDDTDIIWTGE